MPQEFDDSILLIQDITIGANIYGGGKLPWGFYRTVLSFTDSSPAFELPQYAIDPPLPPVFPYLGTGAFASDLLYGKEKMNTNLSFVRGDTFGFTALAILDGDAFDLSAYTLTLTAKRSLQDTVPFFQLTSSPTNGIVITDPTTGAYSVTIASSLTESLPAYVIRLPFDIEAVSGDVHYTLLRGYFKVLPDATTP